MNIFVLDEDPITAAKYHCDKHVVKMVLETAQIMCTTSYLCGNPAPYKPTHTQHPCRLWSQKTLGNWLWLHRLGLALAEEYKMRYDKHHKSAKIIADIPTPHGIDMNLALTPFVQCMPEQYHVTGDAVQAYRNYYIGDKLPMCTYTGADWPDWLPK